MRLMPETPLLQDPDRAALRAAHVRGEAPSLEPLCRAARLGEAGAARVAERARLLALGARARARRRGGVEVFLHEYDLSSHEGVLLMCLAEALLRIPDPGTRERLIEDKLARGDWDAHLGHGGSLLVNAGTWALLLTGRVLMPGRAADTDAPGALRRVAARIGARATRLALEGAMAILARQFVLGRDMAEALRRSAEEVHGAVRYSFDRLGEAARGAGDAARYLAAYREAIAALGAAGLGAPDPFAAAGVSLKLSALHPRFEFAQRARWGAQLLPRLRELVSAARAAGVALSLDAEESERLEPLLDVFHALYHAPESQGWEGLGLAVQAYQKRAPGVLEWLAAQARRGGRRIAVRLVKGAYWDSEIKRAQQLGLEEYPVFTRKAATDVSYLACVRFLFAHRELFYPQLATHNAHTAAFVLEAAGGCEEFEFQRLHGMGEGLYEALREDLGVAIPCRVYAPVGGHEALLPYLMRRLLENGANTSFVNRLVDEAVPIADVVADPLARLEAAGAGANPAIPPPPQLYGPGRRNAGGIDLADPAAVAALQARISEACARGWTAAPLIDGEAGAGSERTVFEPAHHGRVLGTVHEADAASARAALACAARAAPEWDRAGGAARAQCLERAAQLIEEHGAELISLSVREGGRTVRDAQAEWREAVDGCRYYAVQAREHCDEGLELTGPTGESNRLYLRGRGVFACISPWNFPLAIFTGQVAAALAAGNAVIAKPARQTPLAAFRITRLLHEAGIPGEVLQLVPGSGPALGAVLLEDARLAGVAITGSTGTARAVQRRLVERGGPMVPLIAETGGLNAMIVDSSALIEQVVTDVLESAFNSAGQRCSALRLLFVQEDIADALLGLLAEAMDELRIGDPGELATDVGPLIDGAACEALDAHAARMDREGRLVRALEPGADCADGSFFGPRLYEIAQPALLQEEVFGPILHAVRYPAGGIDGVIEAINATGYGLTLGVHTRIDAVWERVRARARVGNLYVNRNMIGAVVGVQPFGGEGLSGTGPKAGGPHYVERFAVERTVSVNTAAAGGNADLFAAGDP